MEFAERCRMLNRCLADTLVRCLNCNRKHSNQAAWCPGRGKLSPGVVAVAVVFHCRPHYPCPQSRPLFRRPQRTQLLQYPLRQQTPHQQPQRLGQSEGRHQREISLVKSLGK
jgi:hypothetical protein